MLQPFWASIGRRRRRWTFWSAANTEARVRVRWPPIWRPEYDLLVRVGGANAGHMVWTEGRPGHVQAPAVGHELMSGKAPARSWSCHLRPPSCSGPIADHGVEKGRLFIDPQAMIVEDEDRTRGEAAPGNDLIDRARSRGCNRQESAAGSCFPRRATGRTGRRTQAFRSCGWRRVRGGVRQPRSNLLGRYAGHRLEHSSRGIPLGHVTGHHRERVVSQTPALGPATSRRIIMVCRTYPIRVGDPPEGDGWSGPMWSPIDAETIAERSKVPMEDIRETERGSVSGEAATVR